MTSNVALLFVTFLCASAAIVCVAKPVFEQTVDLFDVSKIDLENIDCNSKTDIIDECGLQQGFSYRYSNLEPPRNFSLLQKACKRQHESLRCLKAHAKCLPPLSKQVLLALVSSRNKYNKKICAEKQSDAATKLLEYEDCMFSKGGVERAIKAEINSIITPEAIVHAKFSTTQERIKYSCCSVARVRKEFLDASDPQCKEFQSAASEMIDSYLSDTVGIICPDFESKAQNCDKLSTLELGKPVSKSFIKPIINVVQTLSNM